MLLIGAVLVISIAIAHIFFANSINRSSAERSLTVEGAMVAGLLVTGDQIHLNPELLKQWKLDPNFSFACVFDKNNQLLAAVGGIHIVEAAEAEQRCRELGSIENGWFNFSTILANVTISEASQGAVARIALIGHTVFPWSAFFIAFLWLSLLVMALMAAAYLVAERMHTRIQKPLHQIAAAAQRVSLYKDYSLRISTGTISAVPSEIAAVMESMNAMLEEIEDRDQRLTRKTAELEKAKEMADAANSAKSHFLANVSHELRTPLNAIIGFSTMMTQAHFGPMGNVKYSEYARDIHDSGAHLLEIINDILDLSNAESGKLRMNFELFSIAKIVDKALHIIEGQALERKIDIYTDIPAKLPKIIADRVRMVQILLNLLSNALKCTPEGGKVIVRVSAEAAQNSVHFFDIEVEDNGVGMTSNEIAKAFVTFNQADAGFNRKYEGAGLGLPLTKRLVEMHHGRIKINSTKGVGTTVSIRLPSDPALLD